MACLQPRHRPNSDRSPFAPSLFPFASRLRPSVSVSPPTARRPGAIGCSISDCRGTCRKRGPARRGRARGRAAAGRTPPLQPLLPTGARPTRAARPLCAWGRDVRPATARPCSAGGGLHAPLSSPCVRVLARARRPSQRARSDLTDRRRLIVASQTAALRPHRGRVTTATKLRGRAEGLCMRGWPDARGRGCADSTAVCL